MTYAYALERDGEIEFEALGHGAGIAIWGLRSLIIGHGACPAVASGFGRAFSSDSRSVLALLNVFARSLSFEGGRPIYLSPPGHADITKDEVCIIASLAAAQAGDTERMKSHICWLTKKTANEASFVAARHLGRVFLKHNLPIEAPSKENETKSERHRTSRYRDRASSASL